MRCLCCKGPYHEATGHIDRGTGALFCGACTKSFVRWLSGHLKRKWSGHSFYEAAAISCSAVRA